jgi:hypothetical protein
MIRRSGETVFGSAGIPPGIPNRFIGSFSLKQLGKETWV